MAGIAEDITEVVVLRILNQVENVIKEGQIEKILTPEQEQREYIDLNDTNEIAEITKLLVNLIVYIWKEYSRISCLYQRTTFTRITKFPS